MGWIDAELALTALGRDAFADDAHVLRARARPRRPARCAPGFWFYLGALTATLGIGVVAAFVLGDAAASSDPSSPKTWVAIVDIVAAVFLLVSRRSGDAAASESSRRRQA